MNAVLSWPRPISSRAVIESGWPLEEPDDRDDLPPEVDDASWLELDDDSIEALTPEDDYETQPDPGDFWTAEDL